MSVDHISKFIGRARSKSSESADSNYFNQRHSDSYEARSFKNSRRRLPFVNESQNHGESIVPIPSCKDKKYEYAVNAALTQFRMHPVRVASFKKYAQ